MSLDDLKPRGLLDGADNWLSLADNQGGFDIVISPPSEDTDPIVASISFEFEVDFNYTPAEYIVMDGCRYKVYDDDAEIDSVHIATWQVGEVIDVGSDKPVAWTPTDDDANAILALITDFVMSEGEKDAYAVCMDRVCDYDY